MTKRARTTLIAVLLLLGSAVIVSVALGATRAHRTTHATAHHSLTLGIGDEQANMFASPAYKALHTRIARYITPYDVADDHTHNGLPRLRAWLAAAKADGVQPLIAFYHSNRTATKMPSAAHYANEMRHFFKLFGSKVKLVQPWNEANRGYVREPGHGSFASPSAAQSATYYLTLRSACPKCTVVGLDVLDSTTPSATVKYINAFKHDVGAGHVPTIWGLHNYTDTNRLRDIGTKAVLAAVPGQVWLTETGAIVKFDPSFPFSYKRPVKAIAFMFKLAASNSRITRLYVFQWTGGHVARERFDAGLTDAKGTPRPAYCAVYEHVRATKKCPYVPATD